jgi:site-specific DNA-cytosine methylase
MTFPDDFELLGSRRERQLQLGNAVPPLLGQQVAETVLMSLRDLGAVAAAEADLRAAA